MSDRALAFMLAVFLAIAIVLAALVVSNPGSGCDTETLATAIAYIEGTPAIVTLSAGC